MSSSGACQLLTMSASPHLSQSGFYYCRTVEFGPDNVLINFCASGLIVTYHPSQNWKIVTWSFCVLLQMKNPGWESFQQWIRNPCPLKLTDKALKPVTVGNAVVNLTVESTAAAWRKKRLCRPSRWPLGQFCRCFCFFLPLPWNQAARSCFSGATLLPSTSLSIYF